MNKQIFLITFLFFAMPSSTSATHERTAFCCMPIADLVTHSLGTPSSTRQEVRTSYEQLPISWGPALADKDACPRAHQILLHELVTILDETEHEALVAVHNCCMINADGITQPVTGWVLKDSIRNVEELGKVALLLPAIKARSNTTIALASPYIDTDGIFYSAGTFFVISEQTEHSYYAVGYDPLQKGFKEIVLPKRICSDMQQTRSFEEQRELFCNLVTLWATIPNGCIPLVWGGCSIGKVWNQDDYYAATRIDANGQQRSVWERPKYGNATYMGTDASGILFRAAQIVGIPYFCRNSNTALAMLDALEFDEYPLNGDFIWVPGALLLINNMAKNTIIAAMSYSSDYGCLVELPLAAVFKNITTYDDLVIAYKEGMTLDILNRDGSIARTIDGFKILKLESAKLKF